MRDLFFAIGLGDLFIGLVIGSPVVAAIGLIITTISIVTIKGGEKS